MRSLLFAAVLACCLGCTVGNGKLPNPKWKPKAHAEVLEVRPAVFETDGHRFEVLRLAEVDFTEYGLMRQVVGRWLHYDLELEITNADAPGNDVRWADLSTIDFALLDPEGRELQDPRRPHVRRDHAAGSGSAGRAHVRVSTERFPDRAPAFLVVGSHRIDLRR